jgi:hypothetical protein
MDSIRPVVLAGLLLLLGACGPPVVAGWRGVDVHLVDGTWIGTEMACSDDNIECQTILKRTSAALSPEVRSKVKSMVLAGLPTTYVTASGETLTASVTGGILTREAVVLDLVEGTRSVVGLWCYLPSSSEGVLSVRDVTCDIAPLEYWRDGNVPPTVPPGTNFG